MQASFRNEVWQVDLVDFSQFQQSSRGGSNYIVTAVDAFSRFLRTEPMKDKSAKTTRDAFVKMTKDVKPKFVDTDSGPEFMKEFAKYLEHHDIGHRFKHKAAGINHLAVIDRTQQKQKTIKVVEF